MRFFSSDSEWTESGTWKFPVGSALFSLALTVALGWPLLFGGQTLTGGDIINWALPYKEVVRESLRQGTFPHWNPLTFSGCPLQADIQVGLFYPLNLPYWILPVTWAFSLVTLFHFFLGCWGMCLWMRRRVESAGAACLAGGLFMFSGFAVKYLMAGIVVFPMTMAWLPWLLLCWDRLSESFEEGTARRAWDFGAFALAIALTILAGAPQLAFYNLCALSLYVLIGTWCSSKKTSEDEIDWATDYEEEPQETGGLPFRWKPLALYAGAVALACGICAVQILPTQVYIKQTWGRSEGAEWAYVADGSLEPRMLLTLISPLFFGDPNDEEGYWGQMGYHEVTAYLTALPLTLFLIYLLGRWRLGKRWPFDCREILPNRRISRFEVFLLVVLVLSVLLALGKNGPLFWFAYHLVPGFDRFRVPARFLMHFAFAMAALSAWMLDALVNARDRLEEENGKSGTIRALAVVCILGTAAGAILYGCSSSLIEAFRMPMLNIEGLKAHPLAPKLALLKSLARDGFGVFSLQCLIFGGLLLGILLWRGRESVRHALVWVLVAVCMGQLLLYGGRFIVSEPQDTYEEKIYPRTACVEFLTEALRDGGRFVWLDSLMDWHYDQNQPELITNRPMMYGLPQMRGYNPINSKRYGLFVNQITGLSPEENPRAFMLMPDSGPGKINWSLLAAWNCRIALSYMDLKDPAIEKVAEWRFPQADQGGAEQVMWAYRIREPFGEAWLCDPVEIPDNMETEFDLRLLAQGQVDLRRQALVRGNPLALVGVETATSASAQSAKQTPDIQGTVEVIEKGFGQIRFRVSTPKPALLVCSQSYYPGWCAHVNGAPMLVCPANVAQCGIPVPAGTHEVELAYRPLEFQQGAFVSIGSLLVLGLLIARWLRQSRLLGM